MNFVTLASLGAALGYAAAQRAGVLPHDWNQVLLAIGVIALLHFALSRRSSVPLDRIAGFAAITVLFLVALQLAPLPGALVRTISPARFDLLNAAAPMLPGRSQFVTLSALPYETGQYLLTLTGYFLVFLAVRDLTLAAERWAWMPAWPLLLVGAMEAILGLVQAYSGGALKGTAIGTYQNGDHYAGLLEMVLPFAAVYALAILQREENRFKSPALPVLKACALLAVATVTLVAIMLSLSRMGFLSALAALLVVGVTMLSLRGSHAEFRSPAPWWRRWLPVAMVVVLIVASFIFLPTDPLRARFSSLGKDDRTQIWRDTVALIKSYPLFGCGMGAYESCFFRFKTVAPMFAVHYAHNDYLQVLAELGVFGFAAGLIFVGRLVQLAARGAVFARSIDDRCLSVGCLAAMTAILLHGVVDFNMYIPANGFAFAWIAGIAGAQLRTRELAVVKRRRTENS